MRQMREINRKSFNNSTLIFFKILTVGHTKYRYFFITHFSIHHSFLDSYIKHNLARNMGAGILARKGKEGYPGVTQ